MQEWVLDQFLRSLDEFGLRTPWYWDTFLEALDNYHHMVYASAYTYRATVWFDFVLPGPEERAWLREKYPRDVGRLRSDLGAHHRALARGRSRQRVRRARHGDRRRSATCASSCCATARRAQHRQTSSTTAGRSYIFCSEPAAGSSSRSPSATPGTRTSSSACWPARRPANLVALVQRYFGLDYETWGKDAFRGEYPWLDRRQG